MRDQFNEFKRIKKVACVGTGIMGHSWATLFAIKGYTVYIHDLNEERIQEALYRIKTALNHCLEKEVIEKRDVKAILKRVNTTTDLSEALAEVNFVMESVYERYDVKQRVFREMDTLAPEDTILASGSSELLITEIQKVTKRPERCIGAHGFNPPHLIPLVELIPGELTSTLTVERTFQFMEELGKIPIVVKKEVAAYLSNRLQNTVFHSAFDIVESGIASVEDVDRALSTGPGIRWAIYGLFLQAYFNTPSHLMKNTHFQGLLAKGYENYNLIKEKTFDELVRWRDHKLIDLLRVLGHNLPCSENKTRK